MKTNNEFRRSYQAWRMLDHFLGKDLPATRYISKRDKILELFLSVTSFIPLIISVICFIALFLFKNRFIQIKLSKISYFLSLFMSFYTIIYFSLTLNGLISIMPSKILEFFLYAAIINPFICSYLIFSAIKCIKKDQDLVSSINRIR